MQNIDWSFTFSVARARLSLNFRVRLQPTHDRSTLTVQKRMDNKLATLYDVVCETHVVLCDFTSVSSWWIISEAHAMLFQPDRLYNIAVENSVRLCTVEHMYVLHLGHDNRFHRDDRLGVLCLTQMLHQSVRGCRTKLCLYGTCWARDTICEYTTI